MSSKESPHSRFHESSQERRAAHRQCRAPGLGKTQRAGKAADQRRERRKRCKDHTSKSAALGKGSTGRRSRTSRGPERATIAGKEAQQEPRLNLAALFDPAPYRIPLSPTCTPGSPPPDA